MASIVARKNDAGEVVGWQAKIRHKGYPPQSRTFGRKVDAEAWARQVEADMDRGVFVSRREAESTTLREALERYAREVTPRKRGARQELCRVRQLLEHPLSKRTLASIQGADIARLRDDELGRGLAPSSVTKLLALLSHLFAVARKEWGIETDNPVKKISKPKVSNARDRRLTADEWRYLLRALDEPRARRNAWLAKIVRFAVETAMRQGEILALDWENVDLDKRIAHLPMTKNGTARTVPLSSAAVALLMPEGSVVRLRKGKVFPTTQSAVVQAFGHAVARARRLYLSDCEKEGREPDPGFLDDLHFHDLRHEATSRLAERLQMHELMRVTGHKDTRMLARYYHPRAEDLARKLG